MQATDAARMIQPKVPNLPAHFNKDPAGVRRGKRAARLNANGTNISLQMLADKMFFEYCEGGTIRDIAESHGYQERTLRFLASNHDWHRRRRLMLQAIQAGSAEQFSHDQAVRARYFYSRQAMLTTAISDRGESIIMGYVNRLREKGVEAELSPQEKKAMSSMNQCLYWMEKIGKSAAQTYAPVDHGHKAFEVFEGKPDQNEGLKNTDGTSKASWAMTGSVLPAGKVPPRGGLIDRQSRSVEILEANGIPVDEKSLPPDV